ncbi:MAG TPA: NADH-dependent dehydrogenase [Planctomycetaceae bacterium]|nr:NADH-dependent dehydrogenase [Blastopirellula sp.]HAY78381.1 NADH-dependent dehydrogenase [Planctomycetaceae bacterium]
MNRTITRRGILQGSAAIAAGYWISPSLSVADSKSPNELLNVACIGIGGQGGANVRGVRSQNIVALCDVDDKRAGSQYDNFPKAEKFYDFRRMFDKLEKQIDAVVVSTPDHMHFHPSMWALQRGKHLYCEKPLAHSVWETRQLTEMAKKQGVATQLGAQRHTHANMHRTVELVQAGAIGKVTEIHSWVGGDRGMSKIPQDQPAVPPHLKWDLWLGGAQQRPYHSTYCPYGWRFWWDFGTGETGNWGCHILDIPFWACGLKYPTRVSASGPPQHEQTTPKQMTTRMEFPKEGVTLHWYHAKNGPPILKEKGLSGKGMNTLFIGSKGMLLTGFSKLQLLPTDQFVDFQAPPKTIPDSPGFHREWINACKGGEMATCDFSYSGPLAETVLLGNVAYRAGAFDWDATNLKAVGNDKAQRYIQTEYREGWQI